MLQINQTFDHILHTLEEARKHAAKCTASNEFFPEVVECLNNVSTRNNIKFYYDKCKQNYSEELTR